MYIGTTFIAAETKLSRWKAEFDLASARKLVTYFLSALNAPRTELANQCDMVEFGVFCQVFRLCCTKNNQSFNSIENSRLLWLFFFLSYTLTIWKRS